MELTAEAFITACREGGRRIESWLRVFDREHAARLYREAALSLRNWAWAEDVVQDAIVKAWQRCATFRGPADPMAWIRQIVRNAVLDALRAKQPEQSMWDDEGELTAETAQAVAALSVEHNATPADALSSHEVEQVFRRCFERFEQAHPVHATTLRWIVEDGLDNSEIEALLDRSPGATRQFISQCRKKARPFFTEWYDLVGPAGRQP